MLSLLLAVPSCIYSFWHGVIPTSYFIFNDFYTIQARLALTTVRGEMLYIYTCVHVRACVFCTRELNGSCDVYVQSTIKWRRSKTEIAAMDLDLAF